MEKRQRIDRFGAFDRPVVPSADPESTSIMFNWVDVDEYPGDVLDVNPKKGVPVPGYRRGPVPIIRFYGTDGDGGSVTVHVHGFTPYFYCEMPRPDMTAYDVDKFRRTLDETVRSRESRNKRWKDPNQTYVIHVEIVGRISIMGYSTIPTKPMLKVSMALPNMVHAAKRCVGTPTYEADVSYIMRFLVDADIVGCNWLELKAGTYSQRTLRTNPMADSHCGREFDVAYDQLVSHSIHDHAQIGKLQILSFDIECKGRRGVFPEPEHDPVIQIGNCILRQGENVSKTQKVVFVLDGCTDLVGTEVWTFKTERELLLAWSAFFRRVDPDIFTGYNIMDFDVPYLINRAKSLGIDSEFELLGRLRGKRAAMKASTFSSAAFGTRTSMNTRIDGRVMIDMIQYMRRNHKLSAYSLNAVSAEFLNQQKDDVHHSMISVLHQGSDDDRARLAAYCVKDSYLPICLMSKLLVNVNHIELARVTGVPLVFLFTRGQQVKVLSMIYRKAKTCFTVIPDRPSKDYRDGEDDGIDHDKPTKDVGYEGATVFEPIRGYHDVPIATLDFASLYPSIMRARNLCYTTYLAPDQVMSVPEADRELSPAGHWFVRAHVKKGLLPQILDELMDARSKAKKDMKNAADSFVRDVMNGRQLALKVSANSVYGFTGATIGALPLIAISASVTAYGREMILKTKEMVETHYIVENGYGADAKVIYGDTDSVMVDFGVKTVADAIKLGQDGAKRATELFVAPISLEFEKIYFPYLLMAKKRYAGLYWTKPDKYDKLDCKGIESVRRDNCALVRTVIDTCLRKIIIDRDVKGSVQYAKDRISDLLQNKIDLSQLIISKSLSNDAEGYATKQPHAELAERMRKRDAGSAPVIGDRVPYVMIKAAKKAKLYEQAEDPIYAMEHSLTIDTNYYLERQLSNPLLRLFEDILPDPTILITGDHTRKIVKPTPSKSVGIMRFGLTAKTKCIGCKVLIKDGEGLCAGCEPRRMEIYTKTLVESNEAGAKHAKLWTHCQRCQGSLHREVICASSDCPIFYVRHKAQVDMNHIQKMMDRLEF